MTLTQHWSIDDFIELGLPPSYDQSWNALTKFISRPWFSRVWIIQEALAARKLEIMCGFWLAEGSCIIQAIVLADMHGLPMFGKRHQGLHLINDPATRSERQLGFMVHQGLCALHGYEPSRLLIDFLEGTRRASATDARDKV